MDNFLKDFQGPLATLRVNITCVSRPHVRTELLCAGYQTRHLTVQASLVLVTTCLACKVNTIIWLLTTAILSALNMSITTLYIVIISITRYRDIDRGFVERTISWRPYIIRYRVRTHVSRVHCSHTAAAASASD